MEQRRTKVQELAIFTVGIGVLLAVLTLWLSFALQPEPGRQRSAYLIAVPLAISAVYVVLGVLTGKVKSPSIITATMVVVVLGFVLDLAIAFNIVKAVLDVLVIMLVMKTGREALQEVRPKAVAE
jgi:hypothetical protein